MADFKNQLSVLLEAPGKQRPAIITTKRGTIQADHARWLKGKTSKYFLAVGIGPELLEYRIEQLNLQGPLISARDFYAKSRFSIYRTDLSRYAGIDKPESETHDTLPFCAGCNQPAEDCECPNGPILPGATRGRRYKSWLIRRPRYRKILTIRQENVINIQWADVKSTHLTPPKPEAAQATQAAQTAQPTPPTPEQPVPQEPTRPHTWDEMVSASIKQITEAKGRMRPAIIITKARQHVRLYDDQGEAAQVEQIGGKQIKADHARWMQTTIGNHFLAIGIGPANISIKLNCNGLQTILKQARDFYAPPTYVPTGYQDEAGWDDSAEPYCRECTGIIEGVCRCPEGFISNPRNLGKCAKCSGISMNAIYCDRCKRDIANEITMTGECPHCGSDPLVQCTCPTPKYFGYDAHRHCVLHRKFKHILTIRKENVKEVKWL